MAWVDVLRTTLAPHLTSDVLGWDHRAQLRTGPLSARLRGWFSRPVALSTHKATSELRSA